MDVELGIWLGLKDARQITCEVPVAMAFGVLFCALFLWLTHVSFSN